MHENSVFCVLTLISFNTPFQISERKKNAATTEERLSDVMYLLFV